MTSGQISRLIADILAAEDEAAQARREGDSEVRPMLVVRLRGDDGDEEERFSAFASKNTALYIK